MNTRFIAYALFCTHMINGMDPKSPATTVRELGEELEQCVANGEPLPKEVAALIEKLRASRAAKVTKKVCSPILVSQGIKGHSTVVARRLCG